MASQAGRLHQWSEITREERFFTCMLFHDLRQDPNPLWTTLRNRLRCSAEVTVDDVGFEVCFFRDAFRVKLIDRHRRLEKQTFDLVLTLSDQSLAVIEAKAQQGFGMQQIETLHQARKKIKASAKWPLRDIYLVRLCSSQYSPKEETCRCFDGILRWSEIADAYPPNREIYMRADRIYGD